MTLALRTLWRLLLAAFRLDLGLVCELSEGMGPDDYHTPADAIGGRVVGERAVCARCGKVFDL